MNKNKMTLKEYEETKKKIALEISEIFKSKNLSVSAIDDVLEFTRQYIHLRAYL